jgi:tetratricopeptide (TPR) repeat protein
MPRGEHRLARLYMHLGMAYRLNCNYKVSEEYLWKALNGFKISKAVDQEIGCAANLSFLYNGLGEYSKAKGLIDASMHNHPSLSDNAKFKLLKSAALVERELGNYQGGLTFVEQATTYMAAKEKGVLYSWCLAYESLIYREIGSIFKASELINKAIEIHKDLDKSSYMYQWLILYNVSILRMLGEVTKATDDIRACIGFFEIDSKNNSMSLGFSKTQLAKVYRNIGHLNKAFTEAKDAEKLYVDLFGERNLRASWIRMTRGQIYNDQGKYTQAKDIFQECLDVHRTMLKYTHPKIGKILSELGYAQVKLGDIKQGHANLENGLKNYEAHYGKDHLRTAYVLRLISENLQIQGDMKGAEAAALRAYTICQKANHPDQIVSLERLGNVRIKAGNSQGSLDFKKALSMAETTFGKDSPHVTRLKVKI